MFGHYRLALIATLGIGFLCGMPGNQFPNISLWALLSFDKAAHAFVFGVFSFLWAVAFAKQRHNYFLFRLPHQSALILGILYGAFMELLQLYIFARRSADLIDILANSIGAGIGILIFKLIYGNILAYRKFEQQ